MASVLFDEWFERKLRWHPTTIRVGRNIAESSGAHVVAARVVLAGEPSGAFEYRSTVQWPAGDGERYEAAVVDGILDELIAAFGHLVADVRFTLREAHGADPLEPNPREFYHLARTATRKVLDGNLLDTGPPIR